MKTLKHQEQGIALIFVLLILVVVSLLGIGGAQLAMLGEKGARNERDMLVAEQSAEAALQDAEFDMRGPGIAKRKTLFSEGMNFNDGCGTSGDTRGLCSPSAAGKPIWLSVDFMDTSAQRQYTLMGDHTDRIIKTGSGIQPALAPRYIVENLPDTPQGADIGITNKQPKKYLHRVTAMGFGPNQDTRAVLQMIFRKE